MGRILIIAEAGVNHNGSLEVAKQMIDAASSAGADIVKFQTFRADKVVTGTAAMAHYQAKNTGSSETQADMLRKLELSDQEYEKLFKYCSEKGIMFMSTPFDNESVDMLYSLGMKIYKIPSGEITNKPLIRHIASKKKPILLSTGMSFPDEVGKAVGWINEERGGDKKDLTEFTRLDIAPLTILHCVSDYPASVEDINLMAIREMAALFGLPVGFSDHTMGFEISIAAVAIGVNVIEKHFTLDRNMEGPDHKASLEPGELESMVASIRNVEKAFGDGKKRPAGSELKLREVIRRSIVSVRDIAAGEIVSESDIVAKRPGTGISPEHIDTVVGRQTRRDIKSDNLIQWEDLTDA